MGDSNKFKCFGNYSLESSACHFCLTAEKALALQCKLITPSPEWQLKLNDFLFLNDVSCPFALFKGFNKNNSAYIYCTDKKGPCDQDRDCITKILKTLKKNDFLADPKS